MGEFMSPAAAVITQGRDSEQPTQFLDAKTKEWVSVANKTEFKKANLKWDVQEAFTHAMIRQVEFARLDNFEISVDYRLVKTIN